MVTGTDISTFRKAYRERNEGDFPSELSIVLQKEWDLKYGDNPHQHGAIYFVSEIAGKNASIISQLTDLESVRSDGKGKGGLSLTNTMDIARGMDNLKYFPDPAVIILKHTLDSGFAKQTNPGQRLVDLFRLARDADLRSNFGGTLVSNVPLNMETAQAMYELKGKDNFFVDVVAAPGYEEGVLAYLEQASANIRMAQFANLDILPKFVGDETHGLLSIKEMPTGRIGIQDVYLTRIRSPQDLILHPLVYNTIKKDDPNRKSVFAEVEPTAQQLDDLVTAWYLNIAGLRSNGVCFVKDGTSVAMGAGQVERVGAVAQAIVKGIQKAFLREKIQFDELYGIQGYEQLSRNPFEGASCASDGFFPFDDSIKLMARMKVGAVAQPYGSDRDYEVVAAANKHNIAMPATLERCFGHF